MNRYEYFCNHCNYSVKTSGPWPYYRANNKRVIIEDYLNGYSEPINGLFAEVYCPHCDKEKKYAIVEYEIPLKAIDDIWTQDIPRKTKMVCHKCKKPVFLTLPKKPVKCPRCRKGTFESIKNNPYETDGRYRDSPVPPPKNPLVVRQGGKSVTVPKPTVVIDSSEHMGYTFGRFTNWFSGTVRKRLPAGDYTLLGMEKEMAVERKALSDLVNSIIQERATLYQDAKNSRYPGRNVLSLKRLEFVENPL